MEDELANPEDHLTEVGMMDLSNRIEEAKQCKVVLHACIDSYESRITAAHSFVEDLLPLYRILGITADNAADSFDKTILSHPEVIALFHSHD